MGKIARRKLRKQKAAKLQRVKTIKSRYGKDFFRKIGKMGARKRRQRKYNREYSRKRRQQGK